MLGGLTIEAGDGPVLPYCSGDEGQLKDVRANVGVHIGIGCGDVDGVEAGPLADLCFLG